MLDLTSVIGVYLLKSTLSSSLQRLQWDIMAPTFWSPPIPFVACCDECPTHGVRGHVRQSLINVHVVILTAYVTVLSYNVVRS